MKPADIDGCTKWESLWKITFPMISPLFLVNWIYTIVDFCMRSDNEIMEKISDTMIVDLNYGLPLQWLELFPDSNCHYRYKLTDYIEGGLLL